MRGVFRLDKLRRESIGGGIGKVIALPQPDAHGLNVGGCLDRLEDALNRRRQPRRIVQDLHDLGGERLQPLRALLLGDVAVERQQVPLSPERQPPDTDAQKDGRAISAEVFDRENGGLAGRHPLETLRDHRRARRRDKFLDVLSLQVRGAGIPVHPGQRRVHPEKIALEREQHDAVDRFIKEGAILCRAFAQRFLGLQADDCLRGVGGHGLERLPRRGGDFVGRVGGDVQAADGSVLVGDGDDADRAQSFLPSNRWSVDRQVGVRGKHRGTRGDQPNLGRVRLETGTGLDELRRESL